MAFNSDGFIHALSKFYFAGWEYLYLPTFDPDEAAAASNFIEAQGHQILIVDSDNLDDFQGFASNTRTRGDIKVPLTSSDTLLQDTYGASEIGVAGTNTPSTNWKFQHDLPFTKAQDEYNFTYQDLQKIENANASTYAYMSGTAATTSGKTLGGMYMDWMVGNDWISREIQTRMTNKFLQDNRVSYDAAGIAALEGVVTGVFQDATLMGIVDTDDVSGKGRFTITGLSRAEINPEKIANREYPGLRTEYHPSNAIDDVTIVNNILY